MVELRSRGVGAAATVKAAAVLISEQVEETLELMLEPGTSFSCEDATMVWWSSFCKDGESYY